MSDETNVKAEGGAAAGEHIVIRGVYQEACGVSCGVGVGGWVRA